jgi:hypothetical protein
MYPWIKKLKKAIMNLTYPITFLLWISLSPHIYTLNKLRSIHPMVTFLICYEKLSVCIADKIYKTQF